LEEEVSQNPVEFAVSEVDDTVGVAVLGSVVASLVVELPVARSFRRF
jgi:hypothetical protein